MKTFDHLPISFGNCFCIKDYSSLYKSGKMYRFNTLQEKDIDWVIIYRNKKYKPEFGSGLADEYNIFYLDKSRDIGPFFDKYFILQSQYRNNLINQILDE